MITSFYPTLVSSSISLPIHPSSLCIGVIFLEEGTDAFEALVDLLTLSFDHSLKGPYLLLRVSDGVPERTLFYISKIGGFVAFLIDVDNNVTELDSWRALDHRLLHDGLSWHRVGSDHLGLFVDWVNVDFRDLAFVVFLFGLRK